MTSPADTLPLDPNTTPGTDLEVPEIFGKEVKPLNLSKEVFMLLKDET